jgi:hypothetical protein
MDKVRAIRPTNVRHPAHRVDGGKFPPLFEPSLFVRTSSNRTENAAVLACRLSHY